MAQTDIIHWANYIRSSMAFDPGRQHFEEQTQKHGFDFLDNYLNNILAKTKEDDVVDLLKTPGRKKSAKPKSVAQWSKLRNIVSLENEEEKENARSLNSFQKALLQAKAEDESPRTVFNSDQPTIPIPLRHSPVLQGIVLEKSIPTPPAESERISSPPPAPMVYVEVAPQIHSDSAPAPIELSMIAEDDEPAERSQIVLPQPSHRPITNTETEQATDSAARPANMYSSSTDTFHTVSLNSPPVSAQLSPTQDVTPLADVIMLDEKTVSHSTESKGKFVLPPREPSPLVEETVPLRDDEAMPIDFSQQPPFITGSMVLRKSTRTPRGPSVGVGIGAATPGAAIGKRTSWLMKAREAKALEARHTTTFGATHEGPSAKRKSSTMLGDSATGSAQPQDEERKFKASKQAAADVAPLNATFGQEKAKTLTEERNVKVDSEKSEPSTEQLGMLDQFKKTVQGLGFGKSKGKSLGGTAAVSALAEAKALAEARVAERIQNEEEFTRPLLPAVDPPPTEDNVPEIASTQEIKKDHGRLSISELVVNSEGKGKQKEEIFQHLLPKAGETVAAITKVAAPSSVFAPPSGPVFNKPPPVFVPPSPVTKPVPKNDTPPLLPSKFSKPASMSVALSPSLRSPSAKNPHPLSAQSTWESMRSDHSENIFSSQDAPSWLPSTQETEYDDSQPQTYPNQLDDDDSWPLEDKMAGGLQWTFSGGDSTWSSSEPNHTEKIFPEPTTQMMPIDSRERQPSPGAVPGAFDMEIDDVDDVAAVGDISIDAGKSTVSLVDPKLNRSQSQLSMSSTSSSQSNVGVFVQATKFVNNFLGTSKKGKTEVKSLQLAAAAAKKEQEEKDKKAAVLKNMEIRRQQAIQRKAEEERNKQLEEEKRMKEEVERRKREREEHTDKRPLKIANTATGKKEEDSTFKRKLPEVKKPVPKIAPLPTKSAFKPTQKATGLISSITTNSLHSSTSSTIAGPSNKTHSMVAKPKAKTPAKVPIPEDDIVHPSQHVQSQMAARVKAQLDAARPEPAIPSESIELPEVDSEYSDSEDEDRVKKFDPPHWAQSPELRQALLDQSSINPDHIFGPIRPLRMEEIFRSRGNRFRARTSSANWVGTDQLTLEEERDYARRMGFR